MIAITNGQFFKDEALITDQNLFIDQGKITAINADEIPMDYDRINAQNNYVFPGFIDLQIYGAGGKLFSADPTVENLCHIEDALLKTGTTGFLTCIATNTPEVFNQCISVAKDHRKVAKNCLGLHLEGPFLNAKKKGAHVQEYIRKASLDEIKALLDFGDGIIKMMTIAPELQDDNVIQYLLDNDVIVSLGHSNASFEEATAAYNKGIQTTTHLFNAMTAIQHREPGIPTAVFNHNKALASIIADGFHVDFEVIKFSQQLLKERLFLITDAVTECSSGPYQHKLVGDKFVMPDGTLSGSALTMLQAIKNCVTHAGINLADALKMATLYPAKLIGMDKNIGKIAPARDADFVVLDKNLNLKLVIFKGELISN